MGEPMTIDEARRVLARYEGRYVPRTVRAALTAALAEVDRLHSLPVIETCGDCGWCGGLGAPGGRRWCNEPSMAPGPDGRAPVRGDALPPPECPLRGKAERIGGGR